MAVNLNALVRTAPSNPERLNRKEAAAREAQWMLEMDRALMGGAKKSDGQPLSAVQGASQQHDDAVPEFMQHRHDEDKDSAPPSPGLSAAPSMHLPSQSQLSLSQLQAQPASEPTQAQAEPELRPAVSTAAMFGAHAAYGKFAAPELGSAPAALGDVVAAQQTAFVSPTAGAAQLQPTQFTAQAAGQANLTEPVLSAAAPKAEAGFAVQDAAPAQSLPPAPSSAPRGVEAKLSNQALSQANQPLSHATNSLPSKITNAAVPSSGNSGEVSTHLAQAPMVGRAPSADAGVAEQDFASNAILDLGLTSNLSAQLAQQQVQLNNRTELHLPSNNAVNPVTAQHLSTTSAAFAASRMLSAQAFQQPAQAELPEMPELPMEDEVKMAFGEKTKSESEAFDKTRLHVQQGKDGVHAWVRDADLSHTQVRDLARNMRNEFAAQGNTLAALSVNGKKIISKVEATSHEDVWLPEAEEVKTTPLVTSVSSLPKQGEA